MHERNSAMKYKMKIGRLYSDALNLYGDAGNAVCLAKRLEWRGIAAEVADIRMGDAIHEKEFDIFVISGGQMPEQGFLFERIKATTGGQIRDIVESGQVLLAVCAGYQLLGNYYETIGGERYPGLGVMDLYTVEGNNRLTGNYSFSCLCGGHAMKMVGFENHRGRTFLAPSASPLGRVLSGHGNNGQDGTEGARVNNAFGTYAHGPVLANNCEFCDALADLALSSKYAGVHLNDPCFPVLEDTIEKKANREACRRLK